MSIRATFRVTLAACVLVGLTVAASAQQVTKKEMSGIRNYSRVDATVGCGGSTDPSAMAGLKQEGFASVINLRLATEAGANIEEGRAAAKAAGLKYIHLPFNGSAPDPKVVDAFLVAVADPSNQPVFIHCGSASRVGGVWMIKRVLRDKWPIEKALVEAKAIGLGSAALEAFATDYIKTHQ
jgi:uncharacterized protein (TIGR01244 family)